MADAPAGRMRATGSTIAPSGARVTARDPRGLFYGAMTLWQLASSAPRQGDAAGAAGGCASRMHRASAGAA